MSHDQHQQLSRDTTLNESNPQPQLTPAVQRRIQNLYEELKQIDRREAKGQLSHDAAGKEHHRIRYRINRWTKHHPRTMKRKINRRAYKKQQANNAIANWERTKTDRFGCGKTDPPDGSHAGMEPI